MISPFQAVLEKYFSILVSTFDWNHRDKFVCMFLVEMCMCKCGSKWQCNVLKISAMLLFAFFHYRPLQTSWPTCLVSRVRVAIYLLLLWVCVRLRMEITLTNILQLYTYSLQSLLCQWPFTPTVLIDYSLFRLVFIIACKRFR